MPQAPEGIFDIIGHLDTQRLLSQSTDAHCLLLEGLPKIGKRLLAHWLGAYVNCERSNACGDCPSCRAAQQAEHPDIWEISPSSEVLSGKTLRRPVISIKQIAKERDTTREYPQHLLEWCTLGPTYFRKVAIIDGAEHLGVEASNALLKTLERPPHNTLFIFIAAQTDTIPQTILSRCRRFYIPPVNAETLRDSKLSHLPMDSKVWLFAQGRPGVLFEHEMAEKALQDTEVWLSSLTKGLEDLLSASETLAHVFNVDWHPECLRFHWSTWPHPKRLQAEVALSCALDFLEQNTQNQLTLTVFGMELRAAILQTSNCGVQ